MCVEWMGGTLPDPRGGAAFTHELDLVDHLRTVSELHGRPEVGFLFHTVVMVSTPQEECSQSIQTASNPSGATNLAVGTVLRARYMPTSGGILPSWASRIASRT